MYLISQYKKLFLQTLVSYQESPENTGTEIDIQKQTEKLGVDVGDIQKRLQELKNEFKETGISKIHELSSKILTLKAFEKQVEISIGTLESQVLLGELEFQTLPKGEKITDEQNLIEISFLREKIYEHKRNYYEYQEQLNALQRTLETLLKNKLTLTETQQYKTIKNTDFLKLSPGERLRFVTVGNLDSDTVASGKVKNIEFTFTYDGVFNRDFYTRTTAGQVIPPEVRELTSGKEIFTRNGLSGEFFTASGKRLKIHEGTKVDVSHIAEVQELSKIQEDAKNQTKLYETKPEYDLTLAATERGIDPKFVFLLYTQDVQKLSGEAREVRIEELLTDIARFQDDFSDAYPQIKTFEKNRVTEAFAGYMINLLGKDADIFVKEYGFSTDTLALYKKSRKYPSGKSLQMENINIDGVSPEEIQSILKLGSFTPGSREAQILFTIAAQSSGFPESWGKHEGLHYILSRESNGGVGKLNYTIPKSYSTQEFQRVAQERKNNNPIGVRSTASGLGQLLLSNVDKYYPDGRAGIGDALNEAVGMLRYIHDRYGSVEVARSVYGRVASYTHAVTGKQKNKTFKEGY